MSVRTDFTDHRAPNGEVCFYRDSDHSYWGEIKPKAKTKPDGDWCGVMDSRLAGCSTVASPFDWSPDGLMKWAGEMTVTGVASMITNLLESPADPLLASLKQDFADADRLLARMAQLGLRWQDRRDERAEEGTSVHKHALYALAVGDPVPDYEKLTEVEHGYAQGVAEFWLAHSPGVMLAEGVVMDIALGVAGRLDLVCVLRQRCGKPGCPCAGVTLGADAVLIDAKTSGFIPNKHHVQLAGYQHCYEHGDWGSINHKFILQVGPNGESDLIVAHADADDFRAAVDVYRRGGRIAKAAQADRKAREAIAA